VAGHWPTRAPFKVLTRMHFQTSSVGREMATCGVGVGDDRGMLTKGGE
jgi:hypothetical protein